MSVTTMEWTTLLDPALCKPYGVEELHQVWFLPKSENVLGQCIDLGIPECDCKLVRADGDTMVLVHRTDRNNVRHWLKEVCKMATELDCALALSCDTREQADGAAAFAARRLPNHARIPLERMYDPATRTSRGLM